MSDKKRTPKFIRVAGTLYRLADEHTAAEQLPSAERMVQPMIQEFDTLSTAFRQGFVKAGEEFNKELAAAYTALLAKDPNMAAKGSALLQNMQKGVDDFSEGLKKYLAAMFEKANEIVNIKGTW